jgi:AGZA family xanthine/uracil permease-like MFS transporter
VACCRRATLAEGRQLFAEHGLEELELHQTASMYAWHVGAAVLVLLGLFKTVLAPLGQLARRHLPRAALLGSLAAVALALIGFSPVVRHLATTPVVGLPVLAIILWTLLSRRETRDRIPGTVVALVVGLGIVLVNVVLGESLQWYFAPLPRPSILLVQGEQNVPAEVWNLDWWVMVWGAALAKLPVALPFALFTLVGGVECAESAAAAGDDYDTRGVLLVQGVASTVAGLLGGVVQTTPYFGHPAYKKMGAGWAYVVLATLLLALAGWFGWFARFFEMVPGAVVFPVIVYVGIRTIAHSFEATSRRDYAAMALAAIPVLAYLVVLMADEIFGGRPPTSIDGAVLLQALRCLGNGFILTSLFWAAALVAILANQPRGAVVPLLLAAGCSLIGLIHSPLPGAPLAWPHEVWQQLAESRDVRLQFQSPFHWAAAYVLAAGLLLVASLLPSSAAAEEDSTHSDPVPNSTVSQPAEMTRTESQTESL